MRFSAIAAVTAMAPALISAHGGSGGFNAASLKARSVFDTIRAEAQAAEDHVHARDASEKRQVGGTDGSCGPNIGSCAAGYCCSQEGWCGNTGDYCYSPGCQYAYGPGCPDNATPAGTNTSSIARTKVGSVPYGGVGVYACTTPGTVAITYDDGPLANYTAHILDLLDSYNSKATFFWTGNNINKGEIDIAANGYVPIVQRAYNAGHQIASHTWTHLDLSAISRGDRLNQMYKQEMALRNILGVIPTYMRPPYSSCTAASGCEADLANLGYHIVYFNVDTDDYEQDDPSLIQNSKNWYSGNITAGGATPATSEWLSISHDIHAQTAYNLTDYMLSTAIGLGYRMVTVGECLGDPVANWYRSGTGSGSTSTTTTSAPGSTSTRAVSSDATCGGTSGFTCQGSPFGNCCSVNGWCGSTAGYCGTGCQAGFGSCTGSGSGTTTSTGSAPTGSLTVSPDATCGGAKRYTCQGSTFGNCCSVNGWCGSTTGYCGTGCQSGFGTCGNAVSARSESASSTSTTTSSAPGSTSSLAVSTDATCGGTSGFTCQGSEFGDCCSVNGWCGSTTGYCDTGCQSGFGTCGSAVSARSESASSTTAPTTTWSDTSAPSSTTCTNEDVSAPTDTP